MGNETNCSTNQMARKPMNVNKNSLFPYDRLNTKSQSISVNKIFFFCEILGEDKKQYYLVSFMHLDTFSAELHEHE